MRDRDPLDGFVGEVREAVHAEADRGGRKRDFAAMIARAHALDPGNVSRAAVAEAAQFAPVVALPRRRIAPAPTREEVRAEAPPASSRRWLLVAAAGLLLVGAFAGAATQLRRNEEAATPTAAPLVAPLPAGPSATAAGSGAARTKGHVYKNMSERTIGPDSAGDGTTGPLEEALPAAAPTVGELHGAVEEDMFVKTGGSELSRLAGETGRDEASGRSVAGGQAEAARNPTGPRSRRQAEVRPEEAAPEEAAWVALDRAAREAWRRGDTDEARALLSALVRSDAAPATIELAYGDLFVLARQAGDSPGLVRLWQRYLARFPRGLYAEDARVGLCRRASGAEASDCWDMYLKTWPEGAYAGEASGARDKMIAPVMPAPASGTQEASRERGQEQE